MKSRFIILLSACFILLLGPLTGCKDIAGNIKARIGKMSACGSKGQTRELVYSIGGDKFIYTYEWLE